MAECFHRAAIGCEFFAFALVRIETTITPFQKKRDMKVGPYQLRTILLVAPMPASTDRPFRQLCKRMGAGMAVSENVASNFAAVGSEKTLRRAQP